MEVSMAKTNFELWRNSSQRIYILQTIVTKITKRLSFSYPLQNFCIYTHLVIIRSFLTRHMIIKNAILLKKFFRIFSF